MIIPPRLKLIVLALGAVAVIIQLVPVSRSNPPVTAELEWDSPATKAFARAACFDCHSYETRWPWYSYIAPVSWLIAKDVKEGREVLNFSAITEDDSAGSLVKRINNGTMPPANYTALHPEARLTVAQKQDFITGLKLSFQSLSDQAKPK
jgi:hypothetical protein